MELLLQLLNGLQIGSIYALISLGYTMVYGTAKLINFAHGDIIMVGAYVSLFAIPLLSSAGIPIWVSIIPAILVCVILGLAMERFAYRPLRKSPRISNLITAIAISILLQNIAVKFIGAAARPFPKMFHVDNIDVGPLSISFNTIATIVVTIILSVLLELFMRKSKYGKAMIATSEDADAAKLVGINIDRTIAMTFAIGSALAAVGSIFYLSTYPQVQPLMGSMPGIKAFIAAVLGGIGIIPGAILGGFILGMVEVFTKAYISSQLADAFVFGLLVAVLLIKPTGIMGKNGGEKV